MPPEDIGNGIANALLEEIGQSGVVDSTYQVSKLIGLACINLCLSNDRYCYQTSRKGFLWLPFFVLSMLHTLHLRGVHVLDIHKT